MLCVYEDPLFLDRICRNLERDGDMFVEISVSVEDAIHLMVYVFFDVIVTDCTSWQGEQNGFLKAIRNQGTEIPLIYFTHAPEIACMDEARKYGEVRYIAWSGQDPFPPFDELVQCIREIAAQDTEENKEIRPDN
ncbi:MAG: response regulator [Methanoregula sp.]|nr:response regulator [Methanoregula sp.]